MKIIYSSKFERQYRKLSVELKTIAKRKEKAFRINLFNPSLETHKLSGNLREFWAFSIDYKNRIIFEFGEDDILLFHSIGDHDIYK